MELIDTHAHLNHYDFKDETQTLLRHARDSQVVRIINVGYDIESSQASVNLAQKYAPIYATVGMHPHDAKKWNNETADRIRFMLNQEKVLGIGEIGLDFYRNLSDPKLQEKCFREQLDIATETESLVVIHSRDAWGETVRILSDYDIKRLVLHSFSGDSLVAKWAFDRGYYLSFNGSITYPRKQDMYSIIENMPEELILLETDCPYLAPVPLRGKRNEPAYIRHVAIKISNIRDISLEKAAEITTRNAKRLFWGEEY
ncbi:MAG TPA: TatD family hydrolase [Caldisericia bacterium]|nr:TatD family hydrolase [Caldisericia bacterium]HPF49125.1 TatD family hydrolase [Caldisericia bacterium]HPI83011.1 TatD family hydrolase [Caldisericia bacterium]HPQ92238.1 TatD family hydrolase [Caldisericia bacterium]HRV74664.1 TatD family hydrolase [Caldisericia bacterium]